VVVPPETVEANKSAEPTDSIVYFRQATLEGMQAIATLRKQCLDVFAGLGLETRMESDGRFELASG
jgi:hypothetical protein